MEAFAHTHTHTHTHTHAPSHGLTTQFIKLMIPEDITLTEAVVAARTLVMSVNTLFYACHTVTMATLCHVGFTQVIHTNRTTKEVIDCMPLK